MAEMETVKRPAVTPEASLDAQAITSSKFLSPAEASKLSPSAAIVEIERMLLSVNAGPVPESWKSETFLILFRQVSGPLDTYFNSDVKREYKDLLTYSSKVTTSKSVGQLIVQFLDLALATTSGGSPREGEKNEENPENKAVFDLTQGEKILGLVFAGCGASTIDRDTPEVLVLAFPAVLPAVDKSSIPTLLNIIRSTKLHSVLEKDERIATRGDTRKMIQSKTCDQTKVKSLLQFGVWLLLEELKKA